ncbi:MAG: glycosyltransferase [Alphaproteobacteria bacterium]|nr:MAG: glycosyltransferase [Alphaproteobacteria bacterium]
MQVACVLGAKKYGGAENFAIRLIKALADRGVSVLACLSRRSSYCSDLKGYPGVTLKTYAFGAWWDFCTSRRLRVDLQAFNPAYVLSFMSRAAWHVPVIQGIPHIGRLGGYYDLAYFKTCDGFIGITPDLCDYIARHTNRPVQWISNFATDYADIAKNRVIPRRPKNLLALGRYHENKAFDTLIKAVAKVPDLALTLVGDGPEREKLESLAQTHGCQHRVTFTGWMKDITQPLKQADLFIVPSRHEPLGSVTMEAWSAKLPVIAADTMGPASVITPNKDGIFFPIDDIAALTDILNGCVRGDYDLQMLAEEGRKTFERNHSADVIVKQYIDLIRAPLGRKV